ncbi:WD40 repeat domain-containing serine/threonine protein kinase [Chondromyces apiculatus]|uniref:WD40 repeat domain-containing serine/threonine protein kinase n=1 Tax=Chondromyces apiculatus TaxID=51 RepID=UPI0018CC40E5|nr:serine/threonine-protein kinase [Chondromyces apiculatus]
MRSEPAAPWTAEQLPEIDPARYVVSGQIAQGGIGRVMRAEDVQMKRPVALKELLDRSRHAEDRFVREALLTARLQHPAIVPVYEAGRWPTGAPFLAMKLVAGRSLAEVVEEPRGLAERLPLVTHVLAVAQAMAYAHAERIIHRDLKPANVLVGDFGETVVIDWGLAKELTADEEGRGSAPPGGEVDAEGKVREALTVMGSVVGTPAYMPPEQAAGLPVDERADVYAVGAMLYHLLSGAPPYEGMAGKVLREVLQGPPVPLARRTRGVPEDLLAIVDKAMARDTEDRYPSARELAEDLERFLAGQLVGAHRYSRRELLVRFVRRHRGALSVAAGALLVLVAGGTYGVLRVMAARDREAGERRRAESALGLAEEARGSAVMRADQLILAQARTALEKDPNEALGWLRSLSPSFEDWAAVRRIAADAEGRGVARKLRGHEKLVSKIAYAPDGKTLFSASDDHTVRAWDLVGGKHRVITALEGEVWWVDVSPDGRRIAAAGQDREIRIVDVESGAVRTLLGPVEAVVRAMFTADGQGLVSFEFYGVVRRWDLATGENRRLCSDPETCSKVVVTPDLRHAAATGVQGALSLLDLETGVVQRAAGVRVSTDELRLMVGSVAAIVPGGRLVAAGGDDGRTRVWEPETGKVRTFKDHEAFVTRVLLSADGRRLVSADERGLLRVRDLEDGTLKFSRGHEGSVVGVALGTVRVWDLATAQAQVLRGHAGAVLDARFLPEGRGFVSVGQDGTVRLWRDALPRDAEGLRAWIAETVRAADPEEAEGTTP